MDAANDNSAVMEGSGNVFVDLGFDESDAAKAYEALAEFRAKGGRRYEDVKAELEAILSPANPS